MSIIVVTGQPGSGKTALVVDMLAHDEQFQGRPLFVMGIPDLTIEHTACGPVSEWTEFRQAPEDETISLAYFTFPQGALVVIDEAQRVYRPRPVGSKVPPEVAAFETHRHTGVDFILLTQHPNLLDSNIRRLVGRHIHIRVTAMARYKYEWTELGDPESASSREIANREKYKLPARAFALYKSSQLHTKIKIKLPWYVYLFLVGLVSALALGYYGYRRVVAKTDPVVLSSDKGSVPAQTKETKGKSETTADYYLARQPRDPGLFHTAPRYDELTVATVVPWPTACVSFAAWRDKPANCRCVDQQGNNYATSQAVCLSIVKNGIFKDFGQENNNKSVEAHAGTPAPPVAGRELPADEFPLHDLRSDKT